MRLRTVNKTHISSYIIIICFFIFIQGCSLEYIDQDSQNGAYLRDKTVAEIWRLQAGKYEIIDEHTAFTEKLLEDLGVAEDTLDNTNRIRLYNSIDLYLSQFSFHFKKADKNGQDHCYWLAWLISEGIKRKPVSKEQKEAIRSGYQEFFDEVILDINVRILQKNGVDNYAKYNDQIHECSKWTKDALILYYTNLHDDFLFPAFKEPMDDKNKSASLKYVRNFDEVPVVSKPTKMNVSEEEDYVKKLENYFKDVPKMLTYMISLRTVWSEFHKTAEWGYMDSFSKTCDPKMGRWPIDIMFCPDHDFNRAKGLVK